MIVPTASIAPKSHAFRNFRISGSLHIRKTLGQNKLQLTRILHGCNRWATLEGSQPPSRIRPFGTSCYRIRSHKTRRAKC
jgi:hypothetical protein